MKNKSQKCVDNLTILLQCLRPLSLCLRRTAFRPRPTAFGLCPSPSAYAHGLRQLACCHRSNLIEVNLSLAFSNCTLRADPTALTWHHASSPACPCLIFRHKQYILPNVFLFQVFLVFYFSPFPSVLLWFPFGIKKGQFLAPPPVRYQNLIMPWSQPQLLFKEIFHLKGWLAGLF